MLDIIKSEKPKHLEDEKKIIHRALEKPFASKRLFELANGRGSAAVLVSDITRPSPSYKFLPFLIEELKEAKISDIRIFFGLGIHRNQTDEEKKRLVGQRVADKVETLADHDNKKCQLVGRTKAGTPVEVFEEALNCDLLIATGNLEYHYFAGYSGGAKAVMPGICSRNTIETNHSMMLNDTAVAGKFKDNPIRQDIEEVGKIVGIDFLFNVILDNHKNIIAAVAGKNNEAYLEGIKIYNNFYKKVVNQKADVVITSPGGYPKDISLYQAQKALDNVKGIVKEEGEIILISSCEEGYGEKTFENWMKDSKDFEGLDARIKEKFVLGGHKAVALSKLLSRTRVLLYSCFTEKETENMGFVKLHDVQDYLNKKIASDKDLKIIIVPGGQFVQFQE